MANDKVKYFFVGAICGILLFFIGYTTYDKLMNNKSAFENENNNVDTNTNVDNNKDINNSNKSNELSFPVEEEYEEITIN